MNIFRLVQCSLALLLLCSCDPIRTEQQNLIIQAKKPENLAFDDFAQKMSELRAELEHGRNEAGYDAIDFLARSIPLSFPMKVKTVFEPYRFYDLLMANARLVRDHQDARVKHIFSSFLKELASKEFITTVEPIVINADLFQMVLQGEEPTLTVELIPDFSKLTEEERKENDKINMEGFGQPPLRAGNTISGVAVRHHGQIIAMLEFVNEKGKPTPDPGVKSIGRSKGYVQSVGRLAAYARLGIGNLMFNEFFKYAKQHKFKASFLHVSQENSEAINLYQKLGYRKVGTQKGYYGNVSADIMYKVF